MCKSLQITLDFENFSTWQLLLKSLHYYALDRFCHIEIDFYLIYIEDVKPKFTYQPFFLP